MAEILKGAPLAAAITEDLARRAAVLVEKGLTPCLAILRVGEKESDLRYERGAVKRCEQVGIRVLSRVLPENCAQEELLAAIRDISADPAVHGCLLCRPLPAHLDERAACETLLPEKDVDCMTSVSLARVFAGGGAGFAPCTAQSCMEILDYYGVEPRGKTAAVIGRSLVIGKPVAMLLQARDATVTMCHTGTVDMPAICRRADILVAAAGKAGVVDQRFTHPGQVILDVGVNAAPGGGICGDVDYEKVEPVAGALTPVPGGVGAVTTAVLCKHLIEAAEAVLK